ncbi:MAG: YihY/virulence factor BrkB family protein [bacterium]
MIAMKLSWYFKKAYKKFNTDRCPLLASALVHATTFSLFPLLLGLISLSIFILGSSEGILDKVMPYLKQAFPVDINEIIGNISLIKQNSIVIAAAGLLGFLWGAASIFRALESTLNVIWKVKKDRPFFRKSLLTIGWAFIVIILLLGSVLATIAAKALGAEGLVNLPPQFSIILSVLLFGLIYWQFPNRKVVFRDALFGAVFTATAWEIAKFIFTFYITRMVDYSRVFGSLSTLVVIFLWIYYSAYIFLFGAELSYVYARRKHLKK